MRNRQSVLVVGAGAIGTAMAAVFSASGFPTTVLDPDAAECQVALENLEIISVLRCTN